MEVYKALADAISDLCGPLQGVYDNLDELVHRLWKAAHDEGFALGSAPMYYQHLAEVVDHETQYMADQTRAIHPFTRLNRRMGELPDSVAAEMKADLVTLLAAVERDGVRTLWEDSTAAGFLDHAKASGVFLPPNGAHLTMN
jgi:hypothetical protein